MSRLFAGEGHIPLAYTLEPTGAAPIVGTAERTGTVFTYLNTVKRL